MMTAGAATPAESLFILIRFFDFTLLAPAQKPRDFVRENRLNQVAGT
jgi:hypothetical protein